MNTLALLFLVAPVAFWNTATAAEPEVGLLGKPQVIEADVGADTSLSSITLYYRFDSESRFESLPMEATAQAGVYIASVPTANRNATRMEFHMIALDSAGESLTKGSPQNPLVRKLVRPIEGTAPSPIAAAPVTSAPAPSGSTMGPMKYFYLALGVLAVGALASSSESDGGSSGADPACDSTGCELTIVAPDPQ